jgi:molybdopterin molybdotransferase
MLEVDAALQFVLDRAPILDAETATLSHALLRRVVAQDYASDIDSPPFDKSIMDGYALRAADASVGASLTVIE